MKVVPEQQTEQQTKQELEPSNPQRNQNANTNQPTKSHDFTFKQHLEPPQNQRILKHPR
jgi:hypothetical protein